MKQLARTKPQIAAQKPRVSLTSTFEARLRGEPIVLLDVSGSMGSYLKSGHTRLDEAVRALDKVPARVIGFHSNVEENVDLKLLRPMGSTAMHLAFEWAKSHGHREIVLITDGEPDSETAALSSAQGLRISIIFIGDGDPTPFLKALAQQTGGRFDDLSGIEWTAGQLTAAVKGFLSA